MELKDLIERKKIFSERAFSTLYRDNDTIYKIYNRVDDDQLRQLEYNIDYLIGKYDSLKDIAACPKEKITINGNIGHSMDYIEGHPLTFFRPSSTPKEYISLLRSISDNLKLINKHNIHITDLNSGNIIVGDNNKPFILDLDDASINNRGSFKMIASLKKLHELEGVFIFKNRNKELLIELTKYGNLDREQVSLYLLNYMLNDNEAQWLSKKDFKILMDYISKYIDSDIVDVFSKLKRNSKELEYPYYIGDYIDESMTDKVIDLRERASNEVDISNSKLYIRK